MSTNKAKNLRDVLSWYRCEAHNNRDLGDRFERLICRYLELDPIYAERFSRVWLFNNWPYKGRVGDIGIDIVAEERATGEFCGIQCKFYLPQHTIAKGDIDSFITALGNQHFTSGIIVSTTDRWNKNAEHALTHQTKPITRISLHDLDASPIEWSRFHPENPAAIERRQQKTPYGYQQAAISDVLAGLAEAERGKLIMACGTGKTFTSLKIAEELAPHGHVLFLVPSLSLLSQSLREWSNEASRAFHALAVCSDVNIGRKVNSSDEGGDIDLYDLAFPATTSTEQLVSQYQALGGRAREHQAAPQMTVVFSTYHSIAAVAAAQKAGLPNFDLVICDEAHRTTGVTLSGADESYFVKVHDPGYIRASKRLYMTATPRVYGDQARSKAQEADAVLCSMDDPAIFGEELHRLGFGQAVAQNLLSDYKVLVLAVDESYVSATFQSELADANSELNLDDAIRITGCWNGLAKRFDAASATPVDVGGDLRHMQRAVAFSRSIKDSQAFVQKFNDIVATHSATRPDDENLLVCELDHVDGSHNALARMLHELYFLSMMAARGFSFHFVRL